MRPSVGPLAAIPAGFVAGSVPFSNLMAHRTRGVDLRTVGTGTVSGTALYQQAGFLPLATAGIFEVAKGAVGPALAGRDRPATAAAVVVPMLIKRLAGNGPPDRPSAGIYLRRFLLDRDEWVKARVSGSER